MKKSEVFYTAVAVTVFLLGLSPSSAEEGTSPVTQGRISVGGWDASSDGSPDLVTEYEPNDGGAELGVEVETLEDWGASFLEGPRPGPATTRMSS